MPDDLNDPADLRSELDWLRHGEEDGYTEGQVPTPGQLLKVIHSLDPEERMKRLDALIGTAEMAHRCVMSLHDSNINELRQRVMTSWSTLDRIARACQEADEAGMVPVSAITALLPDGLRRD